ncbi:MAG: dihydroorotate dehydrogenase electron transfer subunit [Deltaproteobacteria bacterium]|nr:dihydroorotate dehydrogenase electron transfer subunit [Deltaproteobacteria bacterium]
MYQVKSRVIKNEEVAEGYFRLSLECPEVAEKAGPGQFVMLRVGNSYDPLLRRPFSIHRINKWSGIEILYKVIGKGTGMMAHIKAGEGASVIGSLGNGFSFTEELGEALVVGGGIGAAPLLALAEKLTGKGIGEERKVIVFLGGKSKEDILCVEEFKEIGAEVQIATDDGSLGHKGFVTELLERYLGQPQGTAPTRIFSCGPHLMSKRVAEIAKKYNTPCQVSLEAHMACGVGACLGCVIKVKGSGVRGQF